MMIKAAPVCGFVHRGSWETEVTFRAEEDKRLNEKDGGLKGDGGVS
jgi:hypothetical protein